MNCMFGTLTTAARHIAGLDQRLGTGPWAPIQCTCTEGASPSHDGVPKPGMGHWYSPLGHSGTSEPSDASDPHGAIAVHAAKDLGQTVDAPAVELVRLRKSRDGTSSRHDLSALGRTLGKAAQEQPWRWSSRVAMWQDAWWPKALRCVYHADAEPPNASGLAAGTATKANAGGTRSSSDMPRQRRPAKNRGTNMLSIASRGK